MLTRKQYQAIELYFECKNEAELAEKIRVRRETIWKWRQEKDFAENLREKKQERDNLISMRLQNAASKCMDKIDCMIDAGNEKAILKIIELWIKRKILDDGDEIKSRIYELEKLASASKLESHKKGVFCVR